jgi:uncharacterized protein
VQVDVLCLRCIADGSAARRLARRDGPVEFTDIGWGVPENVPGAVLDALAHRTAGFVGWQQEHWLYHLLGCGAFLSRVGWRHLKGLPDAVASLHAELADLGVDHDEADKQIKMHDSDGDMTGYLFRCLHCGTSLAYSDAS